jgi:nucleoside-diphosphate-sugar epimerase
MNLFLTGADGFIGSHLLKKLLSDGHRVICHVRKSQHVNTFSNVGAEVWLGELQDIPSLSIALNDIDSIVHCAGVKKLWKSEKILHDTNVHMTKNMLTAAKESGVKQFIYMSDASILKTRSLLHIELDESCSIPNLDGLPYLQSKATAEQDVLASGTPEFRTIALRPAWVWGQGDQVDESLGEAAKLGKFGWFSQGAYPFATCYVQNLCEAVSKALLSRASKEAFFIKDDQTMDFRQWMSQRLAIGGYPIPNLSIPRVLAWPLARFTENGWNYLPLRGDPPLTREIVHLMAYPFRISNRKAKAMLSFEPPYSMAAAFAELADVNVQTG